MMGEEATAVLNAAFVTGIMNECDLISSTINRKAHAIKIGFHKNTVWFMIYMIRLEVARIT